MTIERESVYTNGIPKAHDDVINVETHGHMQNTSTNFLHILGSPEEKETEKVYIVSAAIKHIMGHVIQQPAKW